MSTAQLISSINSLNLNTNSGGAVKTSSNIEFSSKLKTGMAQGASLTYQSVAPAAPFIPGGYVMSAMLGNATNTLSSGGLSPQTAFMGTGVPGATGLPGLSGAAGSPPNGFSGAPGSSNMVQSMQQLQENMMSMNVYMLGLQQGFNDMNQRYTAISQILKVKSETEKHVINNFGR